MCVCAEVGGERGEMEKVKREMEARGCALVPGFASAKEIAALKDGALQIVADWADPPPSSAVFKTDKTQRLAQGAEDYFITSGPKVRFFWEPDAEKKVHQDPSKTLLQINKIGHCLHECETKGGAAFRTYSHSTKVRELVLQLGYKQPVLPQSMYIVKNPRIGSEVTSHQDSSFLFTEPTPTCLGLWLALDDCELDNGCLWFRPGSHQEPVRRQFVRKVDGGRTVMDFQQLVSDDQMSALEGRSLAPDSADLLKSHGFVPVPCKAGDLVLIHGQVEHLSLTNTSDRPRHTFQLHLVEGAPGIKWSERNWLQYPRGTPFPRL